MNLAAKVSDKASIGTWSGADEMRGMVDKFTTVSIVSHRQASLVAQLLGDLERVPADQFEVVLTLNVDEALPFDTRQFSFPITVIRNPVRKGFGANHNAAFAVARGRYFCVLNPDVRFEANPFPALLECLNDRRVACVAPLVLNSSGAIEDSARRFPTPFSILAKVVSGRRQPDYRIGQETLSPDWVAGMFMLIPAGAFRQLGGFDERYFLYYEDADLCARFRRAGYEIQLCPAAQVVHDARRQSHRNWRYLRWHLSSMTRFFLSRAYLLVMWSRLRHRAVSNRRGTAE